jgi:hypothetical protein
VPYAVLLSRHLFHLTHVVSLPFDQPPAIFLRHAHPPNLVVACSLTCSSPVQSCFRAPFRGRYAGVRLPFRKIGLLMP